MKRSFLVVVMILSALCMNAFGEQGQYGETDYQIPLACSMREYYQAGPGGY